MQLYFNITSVSVSYVLLTKCHDKKKGLVIRRECKNDIESVYEVVKAAFRNAEHSDGDEQNLVNRLRNSDAFIPDLSLVAAQNGKIIGHILFTKIRINGNILLALAPVSVLPEYQGKGVGGKLILEGHKKAKKLGYDSVVLLGHRNYYPRFGYTPASKWNIKAPFKVNDENFMAIELKIGVLKNVEGTVEYPKEFFES